MGKYPMLSGKRALIFDFDGTLVDSEPLHARAWRETAKVYGFPEQTPYLAAVGVADETVAQRVIADFKPEAGAPALLQEKARRFDGLSRDLVPVDGALRIFHRAKARGLRLAVASNGPASYVVPILKSCGLFPMLEAIACGDEVRRHKPAPDLYVLACQRLGLPAGDCVALEDSVDGVASAKVAGLFCIALSVSFTPAELSLADRVLVRLSALEDLL